MILYVILLCLILILLYLYFYKKTSIEKMIDGRTEFICAKGTNDSRCSTFV